MRILTFDQMIREPAGTIYGQIYGRIHDRQSMIGGLFRKGNSLSANQVKGNDPGFWETPLVASGFDSFVTLYHLAYGHEFHILEPDDLARLANLLGFTPPTYRGLTDDLLVRL